MCEDAHTRNNSLTCRLTRLVSARRSRRCACVDASYAGRADLGTGISSALMRRVARGELEPTMRLHRTGPILAFGRLDKLRPGYRRADRRSPASTATSRSSASPAAAPPSSTRARSRSRGRRRVRGAYAGTQARFADDGRDDRRGAGELGVDARVGEVPGEYCPGDYSVNAGGAGEARRDRPAGDHRRSARRRGDRGSRRRADPRGARAGLRGARARLGPGDERAASPPSSARTTRRCRRTSPDPLIERVIDALRAVLAERFDAGRGRARRGDASRSPPSCAATTPPRTEARVGYTGRRWPASERSSPRAGRSTRRPTVSAWPSRSATTPPT